MKMLIDWHKNCLKNRINSADEQRKKIQDALLRLKIEDEKNLFYSAQIKMAEKKGKIDFDQDRFMFKKKETK